MRKNVVVIIPAFNEENAVGLVLDEIPMELVQEVIVVNNNSNDNTKLVAKDKGATVIDELVPGYGRACLKGISYINENIKEPVIVVFIDADYSDYPQEMRSLVDPIENDEADLVIGSRTLGKKESGSMTFPQVFGNWLATSMIKWIYGQKYTDLGPFRAIRYSSLNELGMKDKTYGWTVEMQVKAIKKKLRIKEVPVNYRKRIGFSKISGTVKGTFLAGYKIIGTILKYI